MCYSSRPIHQDSEMTTHTHAYGGATLERAAALSRWCGRTCACCGAPCRSTGTARRWSTGSRSRLPRARWSAVRRQQRMHPTTVRRCLPRELILRLCPRRNFLAQRNKVYQVREPQTQSSSSHCCGKVIKLLLCKKVVDCPFLTQTPPKSGATYCSSEDSHKFRATYAGTIFLLLWLPSVSKRSRTPESGVVLRNRLVVAAVIAVRLPWSVQERAETFFFR